MFEGVFSDVLAHVIKKLTTFSGSFQDGLCSGNIDGTQMSRGTAFPTRYKISGPILAMYSEACRKDCNLHVRTAKTQISLRFRTVFAVRLTLGYPHTALRILLLDCGDAQTVNLHWCTCNPVGNALQPN